MAFLGGCVVAVMASVFVMYIYIYLFTIYMDDIYAMITWYYV